MKNKDWVIGKGIDELSGGTIHDVVYG